MRVDPGHGQRECRGTQGHSGYARDTGRPPTRGRGPKMGAPRGLLAGLLLALHISVLGSASHEVPVVSAAEGQDVVLDLQGFAWRNDVAEVLWEKEGTLVAQRKGEQVVGWQQAYEVLSHGGLRIRQLFANHSAVYKVLLYNVHGAQVFHGAVRLRVLKKVSKPTISWDCSNATLTCELLRGTDAQLKLCQKQKCYYTDTQALIRYTWANLDAPFKCTARNSVSEEAMEATVHCPATDRARFICLVGGIGGGGLVLAICVGLLILCVSKRRKRRSRRNEEELEMIVHRTTSREGGHRPCQTSSTSPPPPEASGPPLPPAPRRQAPRAQPPLPDLRTQHLQKKRPSPSSMQAPQQRGLPLPRPRVQPEPPRRAAEGATAASSP
ncbi:T-cell surface antigen CD2 isoform X2 [Dipodomys merriami]|uniref:T-cell surface antigen CD2 isoform X2 n=1 Tax=Dipodomys merriami TaxID=94247 RepID=UPI00385608D9